MSASQTPEEATPTNSQVDDLLASPELVRAAEHGEFRRFLDHMPIAILVMRVSGNRQRVVYANATFEAVSGHKAAEIEGNGLSILDGFRNEDDAQLTLGRALLNGEDYVGTFCVQLADGTPGLAEAYTNTIEDDAGTVIYRIAALVDVTARERVAREEFQRKIRERDVLLKEVQHRVKNNLQLIVALIRMEAKTSRDGTQTVDLGRLAGRIDAVRALYGALDGSELGQEVDLGLYLSQIATAAVRSYASDGIRLELGVDCCPVSINVALPAGLAVNEMMTNAFKYAFEGREGGVIEVACTRTEEGCRITVADDGVGLPSGMLWPEPGKLSGLIVQTLRENAKAKLEVNTKPGEGTRIEILLTYPAQIH